MIFDAAEVPDTRESVEAARQQAQRLVRLWDRRSLYTATAFVLSCAAVYPFSVGHALHSHWDSFGKRLALLPMILWIPLVICVGVAINTRMYRRNLNKIKL
jgi:uncharacterized membrane protein